jgi:hypothetical protein
MMNAIFELIDSPDNSDMIVFLLLLIMGGLVSVVYAYKVYKESKGPFDGY